MKNRLPLSLISVAALSSAFVAAPASAQLKVSTQAFAAINEAETAFGRNTNTSSAGAVGWMQFMPATWAQWGVDANGDGVKNPQDPVDAIFAAARYLKASGSTHDMGGAVYAYNHAGWYVDRVLARARRYAGSAPGGADEAAQQPAPASAACDGLDTTQLPGAARQIRFSGRWLAPLPGSPGERCDDGDNLDGDGCSAGCTAE